MGDGLLEAALGGALIGLGASLLLLLNGRVAGISGIFFTSLLQATRDRAWRVAFVAGIIGTGAILALLRPGSVGESPASMTLVAVSGVVVGFGTRLGSGCSSGHGVCGIARLSLRSVTATCLFIAGGAVSVLVLYWIAGPLA